MNIIVKTSMKKYYFLIHYYKSTMPARRKPRSSPQIVYLAPMHGQGFSPLEQQIRAQRVAGTKNQVFGFIQANPISDLERANKALKRSKLVSTGLTTAAPFMGQYGGYAAMGGGVANQLGYGVRPRRKPGPKPKRKTRARK